MSQDKARSAIETYELYGQGASILKNDDAISLLLQLGIETQIKRSKLKEKSKEIDLLMRAGFVFQDEENVIISKQGQSFLELLRLRKEGEEVQSHGIEFKRIFSSEVNLENLSNNDLLKRCVDHPDDHIAWQEFVRRFDSYIKVAVRASLRRHGYSIKTDFSNVLVDAVQEIYVRLLQDRGKALRNFRGSDKSFLVYLNVIAANVVHNICLRKRGKLRETLIAIDEIESTEERISSLHIEFSKDTENEIILSELKEQIEHYLNVAYNSRYKQRDIMIFKLYYFEGLSSREIYENFNLKLSLSAIETILSRIRQVLRKALEKR